MSIATSHKNTHHTFGSDTAALSQSIHNKPKYHLRAGLQYLHMGCLGLTDNRAWAWVGTVEQARTARKRFDAAAGCKLRVVSKIPQHEEMEV